jgi:hypothetical protein
MTQGITDFAVKVYMLAQIRAIVTGMERVTRAAIRSVATDSLRLAAPVLRALRKGDSIALQTVEDVYIDLDKLVTRETRTGGSLPTVTTASTAGKEKRGATLDPSAGGPRPTVQKAAGGKPPAHKHRTTTPQGGLPEIVARGRQKKIAAYESLNQAGHVRPATEFLNWEGQP